jgi:hypothetical protein
VADGGSVRGGTMNKYLKYFYYVLQHKWYVLIECWNEGLYWQGIIHDLSKFSFIEFYAYSWRFMASPLDKATSIEKYDKLFQYAWLNHQHHNPHHWNYWVVNQAKKEALPMPEKYLMEMICDWRAMGRKFGDTAKVFFENNQHKMVLHPDTIDRIKSILYGEAAQ